MANHVAVTIGRNLKRIRVEAGLTGKQVAQLTGLSASHISQLERGTKNTTVATIAILCVALGIKLADLAKE